MYKRQVQTLLEYLSGGTGKTTSLVRKMTVNGRSWTVDYDGNGNITSLADSDVVLPVPPDRYSRRVCTGRT